MEPESQVVSIPPAPIAQVPSRQLLAPVWHTIFLIVLVVGFSYMGAHTATTKPGAVSQTALIAEYALTVAFELFLLFLVWWGLRLNGNRMRDLIGGRWNTPEDFLLDVAIAAGFWIISAGILAGLGYALGLANPSQAKEAQKLADMIAPQGTVTMVLWIGVSTVAGLVEEILFRGYFQRQVGALAGNIYLGLLGSAIIFGAGHGYEGTRRMVLIAVYGALFGLLAIWRKSLRPGMMAHAWHDAFAGIVLRVLSKKGVL
jgi:membrane protease YdiL (CAAX protease family)